MDVISMLNTSAAAEQPRKTTENPKMPVRSRTPWDAGGYSLPINTRTPSFTENIQYNDSTIKSPREFTHRPSDSYSSMSSYASSINSGPHSRFSSTSTVSGFHPLSSIITDDSGRGERCPSRALKSPLSAVSPSSLPMIRNASSSPSQPLETIAHIADRRISDCPPNDSSDVHNSLHYPRRGSGMTLRPTLRAETRTKSVSCLETVRPSSPSDAILIKRTTLPDDLTETSENSVTPPAQITTPKVFEETRGRLVVQTWAHKRAVSAPNFPGVAAELLRRGSRLSTSVGPNAEPTPPSSQHPDHASPGASMLYTAPNTPPETFGPAQEEEEEEVPRCMYIADCDTGSQPRKAVSHIFGRNKMCTRLIPKMVWVYYCRKHYQRTRYRNAKEYVKLQYDLVAQQIKRLREWSDENVRTGQGGVVKDWSIAVRKREQKRLDDQKAKGGFDNEDSGDDEPRGSGSTTATAVPQWLLDQCGRGYSTTKLMDIVNRLGTELMNGTVSVFPDIEILPNIIVDQDQAEEPKDYAKRKSTIGHQRSQSLGVGMRADSYPRSRSMSSQPSIGMVWSPNASYGTSQPSALPKKRKRFGETEDDYTSPTSGPQRLRITDYPPARGHGPFGHRPVFPNINEHQGYEGDYVEHDHAHKTYYHPHPSSVQVSPLPAPAPQRFAGQSMAAQLESYGQAQGIADGQRAVDIRSELRRGGLRMGHKRSQSDLGNLYAAQPSYRFPGRYEEHSQHQQPPQSGMGSQQQQYYDAPEPRRYYSPPGFYTNPHGSGQVRGPSSMMQPLQHGGHVRHQSSPMLPRGYAVEHERSERGSAGGFSERR